MSNEEKNNMEMPVEAGTEKTVDLPETNNEEVSMEVPSQADMINQMNNVLPEEKKSDPVMPQAASEPVAQNMFMPQQPVNNGGNGTAAKKMDVKLIIAIAAIVVIVIALILVVALGNGGKGVAKKYAKYYTKGDYQNITKVYHEDTMDSKSDTKDDFKKEFKDREDDDKVYKRYKVIDKFTYSKDQVEKLAEQIEKAYDIDEKDIKKVEQYLVKYKVDDDGEPKVEYDTIITMKVKGKWYVYTTSSSYLI